MGDNTLNDLLYFAQHSDIDTFSDKFNKSNVDINEADHKKRTLLLQAASFNNIDVAKFLIEKKANVDALDDENTNILGIVSNIGYTEMAEILIKAGASLNIEDDQKNRPLDYAVEKENIDIVKLLVKNGADLNYTNHNYNYLQDAVLRGKPDLISIFLEGGSDVNVLFEDKETLMDLLINSPPEEFEDIEKTILILIEHGFDINKNNPRGQNSLHTACLYENTDILSILLKNGGNVHLKDGDGEIPMSYSITNINVKDVEKLIEAGSNLEHYMKSSEGIFSYLHFCIYFYCKDINDLLLDHKYKQFFEIIKLLCENCARLDSIQEENTEDFLDYIISLSSKTNFDLNYKEISPVVKILVENGLSLEKKNKNGHTRLIDAVIKGNIHNVHLLFELGANINNPDIRGVTALTHAARGIKTSNSSIEEKKHPEIAQFLAKKKGNGDEGYKLHPYLKHIRDRVYNTEILQQLHEKLKDTKEVQKLIASGVDIDGIYKGKTPLTRACLLGYVKTVEMLINNGAAIEKEDQEGNTPVIICSQVGKPETLNILLKNGADVSSSGKNILALCGYNDSLETIQILIDAGIHIDGQNEKGFSIVHVAVSNKNKDLLILLIKNGAKLNIVDYSGKITPLMIASNEGYKEMFEILTANGAIVDEISLRLHEFDPNKTFTKEDMEIKDNDNDDIFVGKCEHIDHVKLKDGRCVYMTTRDARKMMMLKLNSLVDTSRIILPIQSSGTCWFFSTIVPLFVSDMTRNNTKVIRRTMITGRKTHTNHIKYNDSLIKVLVRLNITIETILNGNSIDSRYVFPIINNEEVVTGLKENGITKSGINCGGNAHIFALELSKLTSSDPIKQISIRDVQYMVETKPIFMIRLEPGMGTSLKIGRKQYIADSITISKDHHIISGITVNRKRYIYDSNLGMIEMDWYAFFQNQDFDFSINNRSYTVRLSTVNVFYNIVE